MNMATLRLALSAAVLLSLGAAGCASQSACNSTSCANDSKITARVQDDLDKRTEFGPPHSIRVSTTDGVVYLHGHVANSAMKRSIEELVSSENGVVNVVDSISFDK
jgi:osmotically-inducible protein OsmY